MIANYSRARVICFRIVSILLYCFGKFLLCLFPCRRTERGEKRKVLIQGGYLLGDALLLSAAVDHLKSIWSDTELHFISLPGSCEFIQAGGWFTKCIPYEPPWVLQKGILKNFIGSVWQIGQIRAEGYDAAIDFHGDPRNLFFLYVCGIPQRISFDDLGGGVLCTESLKTPKSRHHQFMRNIVLSEHLTGRICVRGAPIWPMQNAVSERPHESHSRLQNKKIVLHPGASRKIKRWDPARFARLANLLDENGYAVELIGAMSDLGTLERIRAIAPSATLQVTNLRGLAIELSSASLLVCVDSFAQHAAWALDTPSIVIYGPTNPGYTRPLLKDTIAVWDDKVWDENTSHFRKCHIDKTEVSTILALVLKFGQTHPYYDAK